MVQSRTLGLDRGRGLPDFITHSREIGRNCEGSGKPVKQFDQESNQDIPVF